MTLLCHKGALEKYVLTVKDACGDIVPIATTNTVTAGIVSNDSRRLLVGTVTADYTDADADWAAAKVAVTFGTTQTDGAERITDSALVVVGVDEGSGMVIYETPRSSVEIVPNPLG